MDGIGLAELISTLRAEIVEAVVGGGGEGVHFPLGEIHLEFHVAVTRGREGTGGIKAWVIELGGREQYTREEVHTVSVTLAPPVDDSGEPVRVYRRLDAKP